MSRLYVPAKTAREIQKREWAEQRADHRAMLSQLFDFEDPVCREWNPLARDIDPFLRLGRAHGLAHAPEFNVKPGFYHWVRENPTAAPSIQPITNPSGGFREPDSGFLEQLKESDLQNPRVFAELVQRRALAERAEEASLAAEREDRQSEIIDRYMAATRTQVSTSRDVPWAQNAAGLKRPTRGTRKT